MTIENILAEAVKTLSQVSGDSFIDTPALDASLLLAETLQCRREDLILREKKSVSEAEKKKFFNLIKRRKSGECVAYILGRREFMGSDFTVNPHVLVPRPDTETLAEAALEYVDSISDEKTISLLDLCTGSGALAVSLKKERPFLDVIASDISPQALETASCNAVNILGPDKVVFILSDLFENVRGRYNIIVSNPPYIPSGELSALAPEVRREPRLALDGGEDGLLYIKKIILKAPDWLLPNGRLFLEAAPEQMTAIRTLLERNGFEGIRIRNDLAGRERVISAGLQPARH